MFKIQRTAFFFFTYLLCCCSRCYIHSRLVMPKYFISYTPGWWAQAKLNSPVLNHWQTWQSTILRTYANYFKASPLKLPVCQFYEGFHSSPVPVQGGVTMLPILPWVTFYDKQDLSALGVFLYLSRTHLSVIFSLCAPTRIYFLL